MRNVGLFNKVQLDAGYAAAAHADVVTAVSEPLAAEMRRYGARDVRVIENGVDLAEFRELPDARATQPAGDRYAAYIGTVGHRVDFDFLRAVAASCPIPIRLYGPAADDEFRRRASDGPWTWAGPLDAAKIPRVLTDATAALLPFRVDLPIHIDEHMKLYQYLAAGIPIVSDRAAGASRGRACRRIAAGLRRLPHQSRQHAKA